MNMLNDYKTLTKQASNTNESNEYHEAFNMLNKNKSNRLADLTMEALTIMKLLFIEMKNTKTLEEKELLIGNLQLFESINADYKLLIENLSAFKYNNLNKLKKDDLNKLKETFDRKIKDITETYEEIYNYDVITETKKTL
jgi:hypothetical protein